jgi:hypothetical protein
MKRLLIALLLLLASSAEAADVIINWTTQDQAVPNAANASHFVVGLGVNETKVALDARSLVVSNVAPGTWAVWVSLVDTGGKELAPPLTAQVEVKPDATAPIPVTLTATQK